LTTVYPSAAPQGSDVSSSIITRAPRVYPSPYIRSRHATLTFANLEIPSKITIYALTGSAVYTAETSAFTYSFVPEFASGVYLYRVKNTRGVHLGKISVVR